MILFFQDEQVWLSRGDGGVPEVAARFHTNVSIRGKRKRMTIFFYSLSDDIIIASAKIVQNNI
jgi:hypothetical protein